MKNNSTIDALKTMRFSAMLLNLSANWAIRLLIATLVLQIGLP